MHIFTYLGRYLYRAWFSTPFRGNAMDCYGVVTHSNILHVEHVQPCHLLPLNNEHTIVPYSLVHTTPNTKPRWKLPHCQLHTNNMRERQISILLPLTSSASYYTYIIISTTISAAAATTTEPNHNPPVATQAKPRRRPILSRPVLSVRVPFCLSVVSKRQHNHVNDSISPRRRPKAWDLSLSFPFSRSYLTTFGEFEPVSVCSPHFPSKKNGEWRERMRMWIKDGPTQAMMSIL